MIDGVSEKFNDKANQNNLIKREDIQTVEQNQFKKSSSKKKPQLHEVKQIEIDEEVQPDYSNQNGLLLTKEDLEKEFEKQIKEKNIHNEKEKRNLKKRLKKKMKKHKKRARERKISFRDSTLTDHKFVNNRRETIFIDESLLMKGQLS